MDFDIGTATRLREERTRLGLPQHEIAERIGSSQKLWSQYECGDTVPGGKVLAAIAALGVDMQYVLTGVKNNAVSSPEEQVLLAHFRAMDARSKAGLLCTSSIMSMTPKAGNPATVAIDMPRTLLLLETFWAASDNDKKSIEAAMMIVTERQAR